MDAYPSSSAPRRRASWCIRLTRRIFSAIRELHFANRQAAALMLRYGQYETDRAPATYAEFLMRTQSVVHHEPAARRRSAGGPVR
jgi:hypothetical protein